MSSKKPCVKYQTTVAVNESHYLFDRTVQTFSVHHCVQVMTGTLESVLHLIGYSYQQIREINRLLAISYPSGQSVQFVLSFAEDQIPAQIKNDRPTRAHVVQCDSRLYGVVVDEGMTRICGHIEKVIQNERQKPLHKAGLKISGTGSGIIKETTLSSDDEVHKRIASGQHVVIVSEKGSLFVVPNDDRNGHQMNRKLTLVLDHGFVIIDVSPETPVHWIRTKQQLRDERRESTQLSKSESIIVSFAAISVGANDIKIFGAGSVVNIPHIIEVYD